VYLHVYCIGLRNSETYLPASLRSAGKLT